MRWKTSALFLLLTAVVLAACAAPTATGRPAPSPTPAGALALSFNAGYDAAAQEVHLTLVNLGDETVYLPVCGPWEIFEVEDPERPVWLLVCEIDFLGHRVEAKGTFTDTVATELGPGIYQARTQAYADCTLDEPQTLSPAETYYGEFGDCAAREEINSPPFDVQ